MAIDFSTLDLELIDTTTNLAPDIYINATSITFTKKVLDVMNYPQYVQFLADPRQKVFAVRASRSDSKHVPSPSRAMNRSGLSALATKIFSSRYKR